MTAKEILLREAEQLSEPLARQVLGFLRRLQQQGGHDAARTGDDALAYRIAHPWKVTEFNPLSRDTAHER